MMYSEASVVEQTFSKFSSPDRVDVHSAEGIIESVPVVLSMESVGSGMKTEKPSSG